MMHKSTKIFIGISSSIFLLSIIVCAGMVYLIIKERAEYAEWNTKRAEIKAIESSLVILEDTVDERKSLMKRILRKDNDDVITLLTLIEELGKEQQLLLSTKSLSETTTSGAYEPLTINLEAEGKYDSVVHMLKLLEQLPYQVTIGKVQIMKNGEADADWKGTYEVKVTKIK